MYVYKYFYIIITKLSLLISRQLFSRSALCCQHWRERHQSWSTLDCYGSSSWPGQVLNAEHCAR